MKLRKEFITMKISKDKEVQDKARELKREYMRAWKEKNANKNKQYQIKYWERKAIEELERLKEVE